MVYDEVKDSEASAPRLLVRRRSIPVSEMLRRFADFEDRPGYPVKLLLEARDPANWKSMFTLDEKANRVEREVIELDFASRGIPNSRSCLHSPHPLPWMEDPCFMERGLVARFGRGAFFAFIKAPSSPPEDMKL